MNANPIIKLEVSKLNLNKVYQRLNELDREIDEKQQEYDDCNSDRTDAQASLMGIEEELEDLEERHSELFYYSYGDEDEELEELDELEDDINWLDNDRMELEIEIKFLTAESKNIAKDLNRLKTEREQLTDQLFDYHRKGEC